MCVCGLVLYPDSLCIRQSQLLGKELGRGEAVGKEGTTELKVLCVLASSLAKHLLPLFFLLSPQRGLRSLREPASPWCCWELEATGTAAQSSWGCPAALRRWLPSGSLPRLVRSWWAPTPFRALPSSLASLYLAWLLHVIPFFNPCSDLGISGTGVYLVHEDGCRP